MGLPTNLPVLVQMQAMMAQAGNMDPGMMRMAQQQMNNMSPADLERARQEMSRLDPATMAAQARAAQEQVSAQQKYILSVSSPCLQSVCMACAARHGLVAAGQWQQPAVLQSRPCTSRRMRCQTGACIAPQLVSPFTCATHPSKHTPSLHQLLALSALPCLNPCPTPHASPAHPPTGQQPAQGRGQPPALLRRLCSRRGEV